MKKRDVEQRLRDLGWFFVREGGSHEIWSNGIEQTTLPRHRAINEMTARSILRKARGGKHDS